jgi:hypothetical protein
MHYTYTKSVLYGWSAAGSLWFFSGIKMLLPKDCCNEACRKRLYCSSYEPIWLDIKSKWPYENDRFMLVQINFMCEILLRQLHTVVVLWGCSCTSSFVFFFILSRCFHEATNGSSWPSNTLLLELDTCWFRKPLVVLWNSTSIYFHSCNCKLNVILSSVYHR